jgi:hypothetical protein
MPLGWHASSRQHTRIASGRPAKVQHVLSTVQSTLSAPPQVKAFVSRPPSRVLPEQSALFESDFLVDTGATTTTLNTDDVVDLALPEGSYTSCRASVETSGGEAPMFVLEMRAGEVLNVAVGDAAEPRRVAAIRRVLHDESVPDPPALGMDVISKTGLYIGPTAGADAAAGVPPPPPHDAPVPLALLEGALLHWPHMRQVASAVFGRIGQ